MLYEQPNENQEINHFLGYLYGIISALLATIFTLINARFINNIDAVEITMFEMLGGTIFISILFLIQSDYTVFYHTVTKEDLFYIIILSILCTAGVFVWMIEIMRYISPYSVIMAVNLEPIYSIIIALLLFNQSEIMNSTFYIGATIILIIVFLDGYIKNKK